MKGPPGHDDCVDAEQVLSAPCDICGQNLPPNLVGKEAFSQLNSWGIRIAIEAGAVKEWGCTADITSSVAKEAIQNIQSNGGKVSAIAMDEPFIGGEVNINGLSCNYTMQQSAFETAQFIQRVQAAFPSVQIGDIEPYPYFSVTQSQDWISALESDGVTLPFFHLDVNLAALAAEGADLTGDLQTLKFYYASRNIQFGVIFTALSATDDQSYYNGTLECIRTVESAVSAPPHVIFQSWLCFSGVCKVPINLPENDAAVYSHTRLINEGLSTLGK